MITIDLTPDFIEEYKNIGFDDYLTAPINEKGLNRIIEKYLKK